jgi:hypothetical protein
VIFSNNRCYIVNKNNKELADTNVEEHGLFCLVSVDIVEEHALMASGGQDMSSLWHQRYGHFNLCNLSFLTNRKTVDGFTDTLDKKDIIYGACLVGKQWRMSFDEGNAWRDKVLELVHVDICGLMNTVEIWIPWKVVPLCL